MTLRNGKNIPVAAAIIYKNGKFLIAFRKKQLSHGGFWEFPGGKIQEDETPERALIREMDEEFGAVFVPKKYLGFITKKLPHMVIDLHGIVGFLKGDLHFLKDHDEVKWLDFEELLKHNLGEADKKLLIQFSDKIQSVLSELETE